MINLKLDHTTRVIKDATRIAEKLEINVDFTKILRVAALLHDIGRFPQATCSNDFIDGNCQLFNEAEIKYSHATYGKRILTNSGEISVFSIPKIIEPLILTAVENHQVHVLTGDLALRFDNLDQLKINTESGSVLTGSENLNEAEKIIVAAILQIIKDVDGIDILYQHLTGEFPVVRPYIVYDVCGDSINSIAEHFGISVDEILSYSGRTASELEGKSTINVPSENIAPERLVVPEDIQNMFFNNEKMNLSVLQARRDWTFITGMWWRLNAFVGGINFVSNLEIIKEVELLDRVYNQYPDKYKPLVVDAFEYAKKMLLDKVIEERKGKIYTR